MTIVDLADNQSGFYRINIKIKIYFNISLMKADIININKL